MPHLPKATAAELGLDERGLQSAYDRLEEWTSGKNSPIPGGAILVGRKGKTLEPPFLGHQCPEPDAPPIRRDAIFLFASTTKPVVYMGALQLDERAHALVLPIRARLKEGHRVFDRSFAERARAPWRLVHLSNAIAASFL